MAIWHMLTRNESFAPKGAAFRLAAWTALLDLRSGANIQSDLVLPDEEAIET